MSRGIEEESDLSVKYMRRVSENMKRTLEDGAYYDDVGSQQHEAHSEKKPEADRRSSLKAFTVSLGVLYLLIVSGIYIRYILVISENKKMETRFNNLSNKYNQSQNEVKQLQHKWNQSQNEVKQLQHKWNQSQNEVKQLQHKWNQLHNEVKQLKNRTEHELCPEGWKKFGCTCYFKSTLKKTWYESKADCESKGTSLVIINSNEEQEHVKKLNDDSWIGLQTEWISTSEEWKWHWVDESLLTVKFWAKGHVENLTRYYGAACCDQEGGWTESLMANNDTQKTWICEKQICSD